MKKRIITEKLIADFELELKITRRAAILLKSIQEILGALQGSPERAGLKTCSLHRKINKDKKKSSVHSQH